MDLKYFSHPHILILREMLEYSDEEFVCSGCEEPISGSCYSCASCNFFLHKKCANLPQKIRHHLHREHPLLLLPKPPPYYDEGFFCDICKKSGRSFVYHCSLCGFDLDVKCAHPPCLLEADNQLQGHQFRCLKPSIPLKLGWSFTCNACGTDGDNPFLCTTCLLMVHDRCISLPQTVKLFMHHHPQIMHTYLLGGGSVKHHCGICREEMKEGFGGYYCPYCEFVAHVACALENEVVELDSEEEEKELGTSVGDELMGPATYIVRERKQGAEIVVIELKHFSHQHNLILIDEVKDDLQCEGCMFPISSPYYGCAECNYFLDKFCIELPRLKRLYDQHLVTLFSKACTSDGVFFCPSCGEFHHGFCYKTNKNDVVFDVRCFNLAMNLMIEHDSHEHPLFVSFDEIEYLCNACGNTLQSELKCSECRFNLHARCATLPYTVWHKYDNHPLFLTYVDPNTYQFYCLICEKERDPKIWFYHCEVCDFDAHVECALGKYPFIKFGGTYTYDFHSHPLTLVETIEGDHTCDVCDEPCNDFVLECTISDCNFVAHRRCLPKDDSGN